MKPIQDESSGYDKYLDYLQSKKWQEIRTARLRVDNFRCAVCGNPNQLHVHHIFYPSEYGTETINDVITLCSVCHGLVERLKKEGSHYTKWQRFTFSMAGHGYVNEKEYEDFKKTTRLPGGHISCYIEDPISSDGVFAIERTNLQGIRMLQEKFGDNIKIHIDRMY